MMGKLNLSWQEANFLSLHGRNSSLESVLDNSLSIILTDKDHTPSFISNKLRSLGAKGRIYVGFNLSYKDEKIIEARIGEKIVDYSPLAVVVIQNEVAKR